MPDGTFNICKGKFVEFIDRINNNDPTNSALVLVLGEGSITDATLRDLDTLQDVLDDVNFTEATFTNYTRKVLDDTAGLTLILDDTLDRHSIDIPDQEWEAAGNGVNNTLTRLLICYDPDTTSGDDTNIVPCTFHDLIPASGGIQTDGSDILFQPGVQGIYIALTS